MKPAGRTTPPLDRRPQRHEWTWERWESLALTGERRQATSHAAHCGFNTTTPHTALEVPRFVPQRRIQTSPRASRPADHATRATRRLLLQRVAPTIAPRIASGAQLTCATHSPRIGPRGGSPNAVQLDEPRGDTAAERFRSSRNDGVTSLRRAPSRHAPDHPPPAGTRHPH